MSVRVIVDTSFLVAQLDERDVHHQTAKALHELFRKREVAYIYLDCVVNETVTVLARRALERKVDPRPIIKRLRKEIPAEMLDWTGPELPRLWERTLDTLETYKGSLSFNDCLLVIISQEGGIEWIASFDQSFDKVSGVKRVRIISSFTAK
ncbi:MAG: type II toxin-antitoxin system VapC family toxin [Thermodesulfobacteriota bacterium]